MLFVALDPSEQIREQLPLGWNSPLGGDRFKITSKVLRGDPRRRVGDPGQITCCSGCRLTTSESVESSTSGCSSSDMGPDDIATLTFLAASALAATAVLIH
jgi:hypothetical protein